MKLILGLAMALVAPSVQGSQPVQSSGSPAGDVSAQVAVVVASNNAFAFDLYRQLAGQSGNLFLSPYSVELALAMTCAGARGPTASELSGVLRLPADSGTVNAGFGALTGQMDAGAEPAQNVPYSLVVANAIWGQEGYPFRDEFQGIVKNQYRSEARPVDFKATEAACRQINSWVSAQTSGKIASLVQPGVISADTRLVLTNAVYFKSRWAEEFSDALTQQAPFHPAGGGPVSVPMMSRQARFDYAETDDLQVLRLPYLGNDLSMAVVLPRKADGLAGAEKSLTWAQLDKLLSEAQQREVKVFLPKFTFTSEFSLGDKLKAMGAPCAFSPDCADFSGISGADRLAIGAVIHKAYIAIDEEGTEAAAATAVLMVLGVELERQKQEPVVFRADHPFLFLIRHNRTGTLLFLGRVENPGK